MRTKKMDTAAMETAANLRTHIRCAPRQVADLSDTMTTVEVTMAINPRDTPVGQIYHETMEPMVEAATAAGNRTEAREYATSIGTLVCAILAQVADFCILTPLQITKPVDIARETWGRGFV